MICNTVFDYTIFIHEHDTRQSSSPPLPSLVPLPTLTNLFPLLIQPPFYFQVWFVCFSLLFLFWIMMMTQLMDFISFFFTGAHALYNFYTTEENVPPLPVHC